MDELQYAAYCGDTQAVRARLADGADVSRVDDFGWTALHWNVRMACAEGDRLGVLALVLEAGSDVNRRDNEGRTVLANAIEATASDDIIAALKAHCAA